MKSSLLSGSQLSLFVLLMMTALAGCGTDAGSRFAARDTTVEYYRVFDIKTDAGHEAVASAATEGLNRNVKEASIATPAAEATDLPGHFKMADPTSAAPGTAVDKSPSCEGAAWTAIGAVAGTVLGLAVSVVLVHVVNPQSFHWTMELRVPEGRLLALAAAVVAAGTVTAWVAGRAAAGRDAVMAVKEDW